MQLPTLKSIQKKALKKMYEEKVVNLTIVRLELRSLKRKMLTSPTNTALINSKQKMDKLRKDLMNAIKVIEEEALALK